MAAALISITNPGLWFGDGAVTNRLARQCNEYGAKLVQDYPGRFGLFAAMPLPSVDATLKRDRVRLRYPERLMASACSRVMATHGWATPRIVR